MRCEEYSTLENSMITESCFVSTVLVTDFIIINNAMGRQLTWGVENEICHHVKLVLFTVNCLYCVRKGSKMCFC
jgi:hypothetical protein